MAKFFGKIGFLTTVEKPNSIWEEKVVEKPYYGDVLRNAARYDSSDKLNDDFNINNQISIIADNFVFKNFNAMRYVTYLGVKWKITSATIEAPRVVLQIGGVYNGPQAGT